MSNPTSANQCPACGAVVPDGAPQGLCPKCLLAGVGQTREIASASSELHGPPPIEEVAAAFPQLEILELIGMGGMGCVFKARQPKLERFVALKLLPTKFASDAAFRERFSREARVLARLNHPNIVSVFDFGEAGGFFYLLMEFVDGANLRQAMQAGRFTPDQALAIVPKICEALQFAHTEGILHRDIKPENILLDTKGRVKIADFGIAKLVGDPRPATRLTATGAAIGTPQYMAPEQLERPQEVDHRADIYSLGVVFYEMLTGELPLGRFAPPSQKTPMDPRLDDVVLRALEKEREKRYQSAGEVKTSVEHLTATPGQAGTLRPSLTPEDDFVLCNPRLPRMARAISVYAMIVCPVLWLVGVLVFKQEQHTNLYADFVQKLTDGLMHLGEFIGTILLVIGGLKLRRLKSSGPRWITTAVWMHIAFVVIAILGGIWIEMLNRTGMKDAEAAVPMNEAILAVLSLGSLVFEIWSLVWLRRNARLLKEIFTTAAPAGMPARTPADRAARRATISFVFTIVSLILGVPFLAGAVFMAMVLRQDSHIGGFGPFEFALMVSNGMLVVPCGLAGFLPALWTLRDLREAGGQGRGLKRALFAALAWPTLVAIVLAALVSASILGGFLLNGRGFIWKFGVTTSVALAAGVMLVVVTWRWARSVPRGQRAAGRWAVSCIAAVALLLPSLVAALFSGTIPLRKALTTQAANTEDTRPSPILVGSSDRLVSVEVTTPPRKTFTVICVVLSNGVPVGGPELRADLASPAGEPGKFKVEWHLVEAADASAEGVPWEIVVEDKLTGSVGARLRPKGVPNLKWTVSANAQRIQMNSPVGDSHGFELARALQDAGGDNNHAVDWSVRLSMFSAVVPPLGTITSGIGARFTVPAGQVVGNAVSVDVSTPPRETFVVTGIVLSNGVPVSGSELRAKLWPPGTRERSPYLVRWQMVPDTDSNTAPWEIVVEDKTSNMIAARLRPANLPRLNWTVSPAAKNVGKRGVMREAFTFEVARALQTTGGGNAVVADWSVRIQFQSSPLQPTASKRGIEMDFVLPANQVATFEVVTRRNGGIVPVPELAAHQVNGSPERYTGKFILADDPDDLDSLTGLPRWKFGIIGPDGRLLETGQAVRPIPPDFTLNLAMWKALDQDKEVIEGLSESNSSGPAYGLRIRTQAFKPKPGLRHTSSGFGTNWMKDAVQHLAPAER